MSQKGKVIDEEWHQTPEGESALQKYYFCKTVGKKSLGVLDRPLTGVEEVSYKIHFMGKSGIGKTSIIGKLAGLTIVNTCTETPGIRVTDIYWPVRIWDKTILFKLQCWDAGASCMKKYTHIGKVCSERTDLIVYLFGYNDMNSFLDISPSITRHSQTHNNPAFFVIGTRFNTNSKMEVTSNEVRDLESKFNVKVVTFPNITQNQEINKVVPILNAMCEVLWHRDQQYIINQGITI